MARPKKNNADYFSHDNDMRNDEKLKAVRRKFKHEGYSIWNMMLEKLSKSDGFTMKYNDMNIELWAGDFEIETERLREILDYFLRLELLTHLAGEIFSENMIRRFSGLMERRNKKRDEFKPDKTKTGEVLTDHNPQSKVEYSKVKESKVNKIKVKEEKVEKHLFASSPFFEFEKFEKEFTGTDYEKYDLKIYYEKVKNWSESGANKKVNWVSTAKNMMIRDSTDGKASMKIGHEKPIVTADQKKVMGGNFFQKRNG